MLLIIIIELVLSKGVPNSVEQDHNVLNSSNSLRCRLSYKIYKLPKTQRGRERSKTKMSCLYLSWSLCRLVYFGRTKKRRTKEVARVKANWWKRRKVFGVFFAVAFARRLATIAILEESELLYRYPLPGHTGHATNDNKKVTLLALMSLEHSLLCWFTSTIYSLRIRPNTHTRMWPSPINPKNYACHTLWCEIR